jgi:hypothetical protein
VPAAPEHHQGFRKVVFMLPGGFVLALVGHQASDLEKWHNRLDELGIEHGRIAEDTFGFDYCCWVVGGAPVGVGAVAAGEQPDKGKLGLPPERGEHGT